MTNPMRVEGAWRLGWTLDVHTTSSEFLGYDENGHSRFDTTRSELGELVYQLKYQNRSQAADTIATAMAEFLSDKPKALSRVDLIVPVPASTPRQVQPVATIARELAQQLGKRFAEDAIR